MSTASTSPPTQASIPLHVLARGRRRGGGAVPDDTPLGSSSGSPPSPSPPQPTQPDEAKWHLRRSVWRSVSHLPPAHALSTFYLPRHHSQRSLTHSHRTRAALSPASSSLSAPSQPPPAPMPMPRSHVAGTWRAPFCPRTHCCRALCPAPNAPAAGARGAAASQAVGRPDALLTSPGGLALPSARGPPGTAGLRPMWLFIGGSFTGWGPL